MGTLEVTNEGETLKIETGDTTTASDVIDSLNAKWPGTARPYPIICEYVPPTVEEIIKEQKRKQKAIDRMAWKAEAAQRHAKRGNWK
jgi:hypothetical protein